MPTLLYDDTRRKENNLNIIRLLLAVFVIFAHSFPIISGNSHYEWFMRLTRRQSTSGGLAVSAFFMISGFLITASWLNSKSSGDYLRNRILRIYPGFLVASVFCAVVVAPLGSGLPWGEYMRALLHSKGEWLFHTFTLNYPHLPPTFVHMPLPQAVDDSMWTIRYEFWCYLLVSLLGVLGVFKDKRRVLAVFALVFLANAAQELYGIIHHVDAENFVGLAHGRELRLIGRLDVWPGFAVAFAAGSLFYVYKEKIPRSPVLLGLCIVLIALTCLLGMGLHILLPLCGTYALLYIGFSSHLFGRGIVKERDGKTDRDLSYGVYLYAYPIQQLLLFYLGSRLNAYTLFVSALILTLPLAFFSFYLIERPALRLKQKRA